MITLDCLSDVWGNFECVTCVWNKNVPLVDLRCSSRLNRDNVRPWFCCTARILDYGIKSTLATTKKERKKEKCAIKHNLSLKIILASWISLGFLSKLSKSKSWNAVRGGHKRLTDVRWAQVTLHATLRWLVYLFIYAALKAKLRPYITFEKQPGIIIDWLTDIYIFLVTYWM